MNNRNNNIKINFIFFVNKNNYKLVKLKIQIYYLPSKLI